MSVEQAYRLNDNMVYVVVVSGFNQPALEACLTRKPGHVILIVSNDGRFREKAERLAHVLKEVFPTIIIHCIEGMNNKLDANRVEHAQTWVYNELLPFLDSQYPDKEHWLYTSGGTKAIIMALIDAHSWHRIEYKAEDRNQLEAMTKSRQGKFASFETTPLANARPQWVVQLHNKEFQQTNNSKDTIHNPQRAQALWDALDQSDSCLRYWFHILNKLWFTDESYKNQKVISINTDLLDQWKIERPDEQAEKWFMQIAEFEQTDWKKIPNGTTWQIPGPSCSGKSKNLKRWLESGWLEQLVLQWLRDDHFSPDQMVLNLATEKNREREADLLVNHEGQMKLIEIKADYQEKSDFKNIVRQIKSMGDRFGRTKNAVLIGPEFKRHLLSEKGHNDDFEKKCKADDISILRSKEELITFVRGRPKINAQKT